MPTLEVVSHVTARPAFGVAQSDMVFNAFRAGSSGEGARYNLRGIAVLWINYATIMVLEESPIREVADLRGKRIGLTGQEGPGDVVARTILSASGLADREYKRIYNTEADDVRSGNVDAYFVMYPAIDRLLRQAKRPERLRLIAVRADVMRALQRDYPFMHRVVLGPSDPDTQINSVETVGSAMIMICNKNLDEELVYQVTSELFKALPVLAEQFPEAALIDIERAPTTAIPLHSGAARYYREREILR